MQIQLISRKSKLRNKSLSSSPSTAEGIALWTAPLLRYILEFMKKDNYGRSPLHDQAMNGLDKEIEKSIRDGLDLDLQDKLGMTPLHFAAHERHFEACEALVAAGANLNLQDKHGNTALWLSVIGGSPNLKIIKLLLESGADPKIENKSGNSALNLAREIGCGIEVPFKHIK